MEREVSVGLDNAGEWTFEKDRWIWRVAIHCPGATGLGLTLGSFDVPEGAALFIWNQDRTQFLGSFTEANEKDWGFLPIGLLDDDQIVVEYQEPLAVHGQGDVSISQIVHGYRSLLLHPQSPAANEANMGPFGNSGACNINVNCPEGAEWQTPKKSVALITNGGFAVCSGALVNNTSEDGTPYFLTANHCLGNPNSWVYYFNHESSTCGGNTGPTDQSISGGTLLVNSGASDVALIELSSAPPASFDVEYAGWDASGSAPTSTVGIHHPSGDVKKICFDEDPAYTSTAGGAQVWWIDAWESGVTEPGSSGSPLFDQNQRIIGHSMAVRLRAWLGEQRGLRLLRTHGCVLGCGAVRISRPTGNGTTVARQLSDQQQPGCGMHRPRCMQLRSGSHGRQRDLLGKRRLWNLWR